MKLPALDEGLGLTSHCLSAASQDRIVLATAEGETLTSDTHNPGPACWSLAVQQAASAWASPRTACLQPPGTASCWPLLKAWC